MTKAELRREMRQRLRALTGREEKSAAIAALIRAHPAFRGAGCVALFSPLPSEPDVMLLWTNRPPLLCFPRVVGAEIEFRGVTAHAHFAATDWHPTVLEPTVSGCELVAPDALSLIVVPGLAFTRDGHRLGRGGGFYDRYLAQLPARTVKLGVCFECQVLDALPAEPHDHPMDAVITERGVFTPTPRAPAA